MDNKLKIELEYMLIQIETLTESADTALSYDKFDDVQGYVTMIQQHLSDVFKVLKESGYSK